MTDILGDPQNRAEAMVNICKQISIALVGILMLIPDTVFAKPLTCDFIRVDELSKIVGKPLQAPRGQDLGGSGCLWLEKGANPADPSTLDTKLSVSVSSTPSALLGVPKGFPGYQPITDLGDKAWVSKMPGLTDAFFAGVLIGPSGLKVSVTGPGARADLAAAVMRAAYRAFR